MWTRHRQQQQRGAQFPARGRRAGAAPAEATRDREAQLHDRAESASAEGGLGPGAYPASPIENKRQDTPPAAARVEWDEVVQPERRGPRR